MNRLHDIAKSIIVATAIATALYVLVAMASAKAAGPRTRITMPARKTMVVPRGPAYRGVGGYYWHKPSKTWRHDGGTHPDTNYPDKDREYLQLEDPEGVWERTHAK